MPLEIVTVGEIDIPSGSVIVADPFHFRHAPLRVDAAPGHYRVRLALASVPDWGRRVVAARLDLATGHAARWERTGHRFWCDSGLACFMSLETRDAFALDRQRFEAAPPEGNYYLDVLRATLAPGALSAQVEGQWGLHRLDAQRALAVFASGLGDGLYDVLAGVDAQGGAVALAIDFGVLPRE